MAWQNQPAARKARVAVKKHLWLPVSISFGLLFVWAIATGGADIPSNGAISPEAGEPAAGFPCTREEPPSAAANLAASWWFMIVSHANFLSGRVAAASGGEPAIIIDTDSRTLTLSVDGERVRQYPVAAGKPGTPSPVGEWRIIQKSYNWGDGFGTRWMGLNVPWGIYGIHGTNKPGSIGSNVSGGCIRMFNRDVEDLFTRVETGTPVTILGPRPDFRLRTLYRLGISGPDVVYLQQALRERGFSPGMADARYGPATAAAVRGLELFYGLPPDGEAGKAVQILTGFRSLGREGQP